MFFLSISNRFKKNTEINNILDTNHVTLSDLNNFISVFVSIYLPHANTVQIVLLDKNQFN